MNQKETPKGEGTDYPDLSQEMQIYISFQFCEHLTN